jgi:hypothetical protein
VKQALLTAYGEYRNIYEKTLGVVFFGTPHRGSDIAKTFKHVSQGLNFTGLGNRFTGKMRSDLLTLLELGSDQLVELIKSFRNHTDTFSFVTFFETQRTTPPGTIVSEIDQAMSNC